MSTTAARTSNVLAMPARPQRSARSGRVQPAGGQGRHGPDGRADAAPASGARGRLHDDDANDRDAEAPGGEDAVPLGELPDAEDFDDEAAADDAPARGTRSLQARALHGPVGGWLDVADHSRLAQWIERIARQDARAFEALYDATAARVHGLVRRLTQRAALAEEVLEETYWQVWREAPRFDPARGRAITWLLSMARSRAIDALRRERRFQHEPLAEAGDEPGATWADPAAPAPQDLLAATRGHAHVHAALASLEPRSRQLVALAFFRGLTHEEIAEQQGLPLGTVKSLIRRALQQLRRVMEASHG